MFNKPAYIRLCILELSKVLMYEFSYDYIKSKYGKISMQLFTDTDSLMYETKTEDVYEGFSNNKKMFHFSNYLIKSKYCNNSNKLVASKMKDETVGAVIEETFGLKPTMYSYLVNDNSEHKKVIGISRNIVATISHNKWKDVLLNKNCLRHSMIRIQSKNHKIGT